MRDAQFRGRPFSQDGLFGGRGGRPAILPDGPWEEESDSKSSASVQEEETEFTRDEYEKWLTPPYVYIELIRPRRVDASKRSGLNTVLVTFAARTLSED